MFGMKPYGLVKTAEHKYKPISNTVILPKRDMITEFSLYFMLHEIMHSIQYSTKYKMSAFTLKVSNIYTLFYIFVIPFIIISPLFMDRLIELRILRSIIFSILALILLLFLIFKIFVSHKLETDANMKVYNFLIDQQIEISKKQIKRYIKLNEVNSLFTIFIQFALYLLMTIYWIV